MKKPPSAEINGTNVITLLSISPAGEDRIALESIFNDYEWSQYTGCQCRVQTAPTIDSGLDALRQSRISVVLCEKDLQPGSWADVLDYAARLPEPPFLIVTSRLADERFWAEALNRGVYDVLAKPFDRSEVMRIVSLAWLQWKVRHNFPADAGYASKTAIAT